MDQRTPPTPKERHSIKREEKQRAYEVVAGKRRRKKALSWGLGGGLAVLGVAGLVWYAMTKPPVPGSDIVSRTGLHWHSELAIYVRGERQEIPPNIGIGAVHQPVHTHDDSDEGVIHMEFQGPARERDIMLGVFFKNWSKDMRSFGTNMTMAVNGEESAEYEGYVMRDGDKIELRFD